MTKWFLFFLLTLSIRLLQAQTPESESDFVEKSSVNLLNRKIYFDRKRGSLDNALIKLSSEQNISISYSYDKVQNYSVQEKLYNSALFSEVLDDLLVNTGLSYLVIGKIIVIIPSEQNNIVQEKSNKPVKIEKTNPTHIFKPNQNLQSLPPSERRKIRKLYKEELKWASEYHRNTSGNRGINPDSLIKEKSRKEKVVPSAISPYYVSASLGFTDYLPRFKDNKEYDLSLELNLKRHVKTSLNTGLSLGFHYGSFLLETGLAYQSLKVKGSGSFVIFRSRPRWDYETVNLNYSDVYSIFTIPLQVLAFKRWSHLMAGGGIKTGISFIHPSKVNEEKFESFVDYMDIDRSYQEETKKVVPVSALKVFGGYSFNDHFLLSLNIEYQNSLKWYSQNTLYTLYPDGLSFGVSLLYFFDKQDLKKAFHLKK